MSDKYYMEHSASESDWLNWFIRNEKNQYKGTQTTIDLVVLKFIDQQLCVLMTQRRTHPFKNQWALPGSYLHDDEEPEDTIQRIFSEKIGQIYTKQNSYLMQLETYAARNRDPRGRVVSTAYIVYTHQNFKKNDNLAWKPLIETGQQPNLAFDHADILFDAYLRTKDQFTWQPNSLYSLGDSGGFSLGEIVKLKAYLFQQDYREINRANLRKKLLPFLEDSGQKEKISFYKVKS